MINNHWWFGLWRCIFVTYAPFISLCILPSVYPSIIPCYTIISLNPRKCSGFNYNFRTPFTDWYLSPKNEISLTWIPWIPVDMLILIQVIDWCHQAPITWPNVDLDLCHHIASPGCNKLKNALYSLTDPRLITVNNFYFTSLLISLTSSEMSNLPFH